MGSGTSSTSATRRQPTPPPQQQAPAPQQQQTVNNNGIDINDAENGATNQTFIDFQKMSSDEQAQVIQDALREDIPSFLPDNSLQRLAYYLGGDNKPEVVTDSQLDKIPGADIYRQVAGVRLQKFNVNYSSADIANELIYGEHTQYSNSGGSVYGRSIYFGADYSEIQNGFGVNNSNRTRSGGRDSTLIRAKVDPKARGMQDTQLSRACSREISSGSKLGRVLQRCDGASRTAIYALAKGIDYSYSQYGGRRDYHMIYNRGCLKVSSRTKHNASDSRW